RRIAPPRRWTLLRIAPPRRRALRKIAPACRWTLLRIAPPRRRALRRIAPARRRIVRRFAAANGRALRNPSRRHSDLVGGVCCRQRQARFAAAVSIGWNAKIARKIIDADTSRAGPRVPEFPARARLAPAGGRALGNRGPSMQGCSRAWYDRAFAHDDDSKVGIGPLPP